MCPEVRVGKLAKNAYCWIAATAITRAAIGGWEEHRIIDPSTSAPLHKYMLHALPNRVAKMLAKSVPLLSIYYFSLKITRV